MAPPFGVYYYFQAETKNIGALLMASGVATLWIPYSLLLLHRKVTNKLKNKGFVNKPVLILDGDKKLEDAKKRFEQFWDAGNSSLSLFEFREMLGRYEGLTLANNDSRNLPESELELFQISGYKNTELGTISLNRRNRLRLASHQKDARKEFLSSLGEMFINGVDVKRLSDLATEFVKLLNDDDAAVLVNSLTEEFSQEKAPEHVKVPEKDLWNLEKQPLMKEPTSQNLRVLTATVSSQKKG